MINPYQPRIAGLEKQIELLQTRSAAERLAHGEDTPEEELRKCVILLANELKQVYTTIAQTQEQVRGIPSAMADAARRRPAGR